jgi:hypothetical protein
LYGPVVAVAPNPAGFAPNALAPPPNALVVLPKPDATLRPFKNL